VLYSIENAAADVSREVREMRRSYRGTACALAQPDMVIWPPRTPEFSAVNSLRECNVTLL
jgi:hypothetical protein